MEVSIAPLLEEIYFCNFSYIKTYVTRLVIMKDMNIIITYCPFNDVLLFSRFADINNLRFKDAQINNKYI